METLSKGAVKDIIDGKTDLSPALQIIHIQKMPDRNNSQDRYIVILSDGEFHIEGLALDNLSIAIKTCRIKNFAIVRLLRFTKSLNKDGKKMIIAFKGELLKSLNYEIGSSRKYQGSDLPSANPQRHLKPNQQTDRREKIDTLKIKKLKTEPDLNIEILEDHAVPVNALSQYCAKWAIKVRVTKKSKVRTWQKPSGSGKVMSVDLLDSDGTEIRATMFNEAVDAFENIFEEGSVYFIARGRVKLANKRFTHIRNDYEITLDTDSIVRPVYDDKGIKDTSYDFSNIAVIEKADENSYVDVLGVVTNVEPVSSVMSAKQNRHIEKRVLVLADESAKIELTLWGEDASRYNEDVLRGEPIVAVKAARVSHYGGRSLSLSMGSKIAVNPDIQKVYQLKSWWDSKGKTEEIPSISNKFGQGGTITDADKRIELSEVKEKELGMNQTGEPDIFVVRATIMSIRHDFEKPPFYFACSRTREGRVCNKKVNSVNNKGENGEQWCEACNCATEGRPRYILNMALSDHSGGIFAGCFDDTGEKILKMKASEMAKLCIGATASESKFQNAFLEASFQEKLFKIKAKKEMYMDEERVKLTVLTAEDIDYVSESVKLLSKLNMMQ